MIKSLFQFAVFSLALCFLQIGIYTISETRLTFNTILISNLVLWIIFSVGIYILELINSVDKEKVGITFLGLSVVKMLAALTFILVQIQVLKKPNVFAYFFLVAYFLDLIYLSIVTFKMVNANNSSKKE